MEKTYPQTLKYIVYTAVLLLSIQLHAQNSCEELLQTQTQEQLQAENIAHANSVNMLKKLYAALRFNPKMLTSSLAFELQPMQERSASAGRKMSEFFKSPAYLKLSDFSRDMEKLSVLVEELRESRIKLKNRELSQMELEIQRLQNKTENYIKQSGDLVKSFESDFNDLNKLKFEIENDQLSLKLLVESLNNELQNQQISTDIRSKIATDLIAPILDHQMAVQVQLSILTERLKHADNFLKLIQASQSQALRAQGSLIPFVTEKTQMMKALNRISKNEQDIDLTLRKILSQRAWNDPMLQIELAQFLNARETISHAEYEYILSHIEYLKPSGIALENRILTQSLNELSNYKRDHDLHRKWPIEFLNFFSTYEKLERRKFLSTFSDLSYKRVWPGLNQLNASLNSKLAFPRVLTGISFIAIPAVLAFTSQWRLGLIYFFTGFVYNLISKDIGEYGFSKEFSSCRNAICKQMDVDIHNILKLFEAVDAKYLETQKPYGSELNKEGVDRSSIQTHREHAEAEVSEIFEQELNKYLGIEVQRLKTSIEEKQGVRMSTGTTMLE